MIINMLHINRVAKKLWFVWVALLTIGNGRVLSTGSQL
jgi:hypothetical protein